MLDITKLRSCIGFWDGEADELFEGSIGNDSTRPADDEGEPVGLPHVI